MKPDDILARIHIASPCPADWNKMVGDERARFCLQCQKHVYNLSAMTPEAAARLVREKEGKMCAQFYRRADGTMLHAEDCPVGFAARQWRRMRHLAGAAASLVLLLLGVSRSHAADETKPIATAGDITVAPSPTPKPSPTPTPPMIRGEVCVEPSPKPSPKPTP